MSKIKYLILVILAVTVINCGFPPNQGCESGLACTLNTIPHPVTVISIGGGPAGQGYSCSATLRDVSGNYSGVYGLSVCSLKVGDEIK